MPYMEWLKHQKFILSQFWEQKSEIRVPTWLVWVRPLTLAYKWLPSCCVITWPFLSVCVHKEKESSGLFFTSYKDTNPVGSRSYHYNLI